MGKLKVNQERTKLFWKVPSLVEPHYPLLGLTCVPG
jgi:hypothetical protein